MGNVRLLLARIFVVMFVASAVVINIVYAEISSFMGDTYVADSEDFSAGAGQSIVGNSAINSNIYGNLTDFLVMGNSNMAWEYRFCDSPMPNRSLLDFDFCIDALSDYFETSVLGDNMKDGTQNITLMKFGIIKKSDDMYHFYIVNNQGAKVEISKGLYSKTWYSISIEIDTIVNIYNIKIYKDIDRTEYIDCYLDAELLVPRSTEYGIKKAVFNKNSLSDLLYFDNLKFIRNRISYGQSVASAKDYKVYTTGSEFNNSTASSQNVKIIVGVYTSQNVLIDVYIKGFQVAAGEKKYLEASFYINEDLQKNRVKAYVWKYDKIEPNGKNYDMSIINNEIASSSVLSASFEEAEGRVSNAIIPANKRLPMGWSAYKWGSYPSSIIDTGVCNYESYTGAYSISVAAASGGYAGPIAPSFTLPTDGFKINYYLKASNAYSGNVPYIFVTFYSSGGAFLNAIAQPLDAITYNSSGWSRNSFQISAKDYPAGATKAYVQFTSQKSGSATVAGELYFDGILINGIDASLFFTMKDQSVAGWHNLGEAIVFKSIDVIKSPVTNIEGVIYDSDGEEYDRLSVGINDFNTSGWQYMPEEAGFYSVKFFAVVNGQHKVIEQERYKVFNTTTRKYDYYYYNRHDFYVSPNQRISMANRNKLFGVSYDPSTGTEGINAAERVGLSFLRIHAISWKDVEKTMGTYDWSVYDGIFNYIKDTSKDMQFDIVGNVLYTPKWASPSTNETLSYGVPVYSTYAPSDINNFNSFLGKLIQRYGDVINTWEVWNEPHLPGGSCFWNDTPDNYVNLLKNGFETIKANQQNSNVWIGGIGARRYLSFYKDIMQKGAYPYFDKLAMHGYDLDPWNYNRISENMGLGSKGLVNTEGHMILVRPSDEDHYFTEKEFALRMIKEYVRQIKYGFDKIAIFTTMDSYIQTEDMPSIIKNGSSGDFSGLFRKNPNIEPRFCAAVLNNLIAASGNSIEYTDEYVLNDINIVNMTKDTNETVLIAWQNSFNSISPNDSFNALIGEETVIKDWEGRVVENNNFSFKANTLYFIFNPNVNAVLNLPSAQGQNIYDGEVVYSEYEKQRSTGTSLSGASSYGTLFNHITGELKTDIVWNTDNWNRNDSVLSEQDFNAKYAISKCSDGIDLAVSVTDSSLYATGSDNGDNLNISIDTMGNGISADVMELIATFVPNGNGGSVSLKKIYTPNISGNLPSNWTTAGNEVSHKIMFATRQNDTTTYLIHIDSSELYPYFYDEPQPFRISIAVNNYIADGGNGINAGSIFWSDGDSYARWLPNNFGKVYLIVMDEYKAIVELSGNTEANKFTTVLVKDDNGNVAYYNQTKSDNSGNYLFSFPLKENGVYSTYLYDAGIDKLHVKKILYTK